MTENERTVAHLNKQLEKLGRMHATPGHYEITTYSQCYMSLTTLACTPEQQVAEIVFIEDRPANWSRKDGIEWGYDRRRSTGIQMVRKTQEAAAKALGKQLAVVIEVHRSMGIRPEIAREMSETRDRLAKLEHAA